MGRPSTDARPRGGRISARLLALALDPVGIWVPTFPQQQFACRSGHHVPDLRTGPFRAGLRMKSVRRAPDVFELTWDGNGRATWSYGKERIRGAKHTVWRRTGGHDILAGPRPEVSQALSRVKRCGPDELGSACPLGFGPTGCITPEDMMTTPLPRPSVEEEGRWRR